MPHALIAGGSKGIGFAIAAAFARRNYDLILIGRSEEGLRVAKSRLETSYKTQVRTLCHDLSSREASWQIAEWCLVNRIKLTALCNVAGLGGTNDFLRLPLEQLQSMIQLNLGSSVDLTAKLIPLLERNAPSYILNVGSMAGFAPIPIKNVYSATKSGIIFFSYALRYQLMAKDISVSCLCPGPVFTKPEIEAETRNKLGRFGDWMAVSPERVGEIAVQQTLNKRMIIIPGVLSKIMSFFLRIIPNHLLASIYYQLGNKKTNL